MLKSSSIRKLKLPTVAGLVLAGIAFAGHGATAAPVAVPLHATAGDAAAAPLLAVQYYPGYGYREGPHHRWWRHEMWRRHLRHEHWRYEHRYGYGGRY